MVYIPYTTLQDLTGRDSFDQIAVRVGTAANVERVENNILRTLEGSTGLSGAYRTDNLAAQRDQLTGLMDIVTLVLTVISGISLIVSGLGIMTIMLVSVNERTRKSGPKSHRRHPAPDFLEFLSEAVMISLGGSLWDCVGQRDFGFGPGIVRRARTLQLAGMLLLIAFAVMTGAIFGVYPL